MAKRYTLNEVLNMDKDEIARMNTQEMRHAVQTLNDVANKRVKRLEESGETTAYAYAKYAPQEGNLRFNMPKDATGPNARNRLYKQLVNVMGFVKSDTSTLSGWRRVKNKVTKAGRKGSQGFDIDKILTDKSTASEFFTFTRHLEDRGYDSENAISTASYYFDTFDTPEKAMAGLEQISRNRQGGALDLRGMNFSSRTELYEFMLDMTGDKFNEWEDIDDEEYHDLW